MTSFYARTASPLQEVVEIVEIAISFWSWEVTRYRGILSNDFFQNRESLELEDKNYWKIVITEIFTASGRRWLVM